MTKRLVFWLVLVCMIASSAIMASATVSESPVLTTDKAVVSSIDTKDLEKKYADVFFGEKSSNEESLLVKMSFVRDYSIEEPLAHILSGNALDKTNITFTDPYVMLMYIQTEEGYQPLFLRDASEETVTNKVEGLLMLYAKVKLLNLGKDVDNDVRLIIFKKSHVENLILGKTLQITDLSIVARNYTLVERVKVNLNNVVDTVTAIPR